MDFYYVTGSSRGIGKALVEKILENENNFVYGLSRNNFILHDRFEHYRIDLSNIEEVKKFPFQEHKRSERVVLINNAATLGEVLPIGKHENEEIANTFHLNLITPSILINKFIQYYRNFFGTKQIINISSGAGRHAIESWAVYCASKSGLDLLSEVINLENSKDKNFQIWSIAPGIVDTKMQEEIRKVQFEDFPNVNQFIDYKEKNQLYSPNFVANKIISILNSPQKYAKVCLDIRNLD